MSATYPFGLLVVFFVAVLAWGYGHAPGDSRPSEDASREIARVRHHLEGAEALLLARDVSTLTPAQRAARTRLIAELRVYRQRGVFPHNHQLFGRRTPVFVDEHGTRCAMAYLIERSREGSLVSGIGRTRNLARIRDLAGDPALAPWLDRNGLTLDEAARIQPEYGGTVDVTGPSPGVWAASAVGAGAGLTGVGFNVSIGATQNARNARGLLGVVCGLLGAGLGVRGLSEDGGGRVLGAVDIGVGLASFGLGIRQLNATGERRPQAAADAIAPAVWCDGGGMQRVALVMRF